MTLAPINLTLAAVFALLVQMPLVQGEEVGAKTAVAQPQFAVFRSYGCSRSFGFDSSHATLAAAIHQAQELRQSKALAWVVTGKPGTDPQTWADFTLVRARPDLLKVEMCSIYQRQCRGGFRLAHTTPSYEKAQVLAGEARQDGSDVEVVYLMGKN